jgi:hypothetical protein
MLPDSRHPWRDPGSVSWKIIWTLADLDPKHCPIVLSGCSAHLSWSGLRIWIQILGSDRDPYGSKSAKLVGSLAIAGKSFKNSRNFQEGIVTRPLRGHMRWSRTVKEGNLGSTGGPSMRWGESRNRTSLADLKLGVTRGTLKKLAVAHGVSTKTIHATLHI